LLNLIFEFEIFAISNLNKNDREKLFPRKKNYFHVKSFY